MSSNRLHNELYKMAIQMSKYNNKSVKQNLDFLLSTVSARNNECNNSVQLKFSDILHKI